MHKLLTLAGNNIKHKTIEMINKFCHYCQIKGKAAQHFKFTLKKNVDFNYKIIIDIIYLNEKPILHAICNVVTRDRLIGLDHPGLMRNNLPTLNLLDTG